MEFNRLVSLVLGFIVLILVFVWISGRFRANTRTADTRTVSVTPTATPSVTPTKTTGTIWNPFGFLSRNTPTPTVVVKKNSPTPIKIRVENNNATGQSQTSGSTSSNSNSTIQTDQIGSRDVLYKNYKTGKTIVVNQIPETGAPTIFMSLALAGLTGGMYLRRKI